MMRLDTKPGEEIVFVGPEKALLKEDKELVTGWDFPKGRVFTVRGVKGIRVSLMEIDGHFSTEVFINMDQA